MPFSAASVMAWVHGVPATMAMKICGFLEARVVIGSVIVGACGSIVSVTYSMSSLIGDCANQARKPTS